MELDGNSESDHDETKSHQEPSDEDKEDDFVPDVRHGVQRFRKKREIWKRSDKSEMQNNDSSQQQSQSRRGRGRGRQATS